MRKYILLLFILVFDLTFSQIAIDKTSVSNSSVSLEFGSQNKGLVLPWVTSAVAVVDVAEGTMIFDSADKKVKYYNGSWIDLSVDATGTVDVSLQNGLKEESDAKTTIGTLSNTPGILILEDHNKSMILPKVDAPNLNIINPAPGMIVYDKQKKQLAVFNGSVWSFWKP